ncbi:MAG: RNA polymerase sigma factor [Candidatus Saccharibacteria bacterium]
MLPRIEMPGNPFASVVCGDACDVTALEFAYDEAPIELLPLGQESELSPQELRRLQEQRDWELVALAREPGPEGERAFEELWHNNYGPICRLLSKRECPPHLVEELASETFTRFFQRLEDLQQIDNSAVRAWLYTVAGNLLSNYKKNYHTRMSIPIGDFAEGHVAFSGSAPISPEEALMKTLESDDIEAAMQHLNQRQRDAIRLRFFEGASDAEIASRLNIREGASRQLRFRALAILRKHVSPPSL